MTICKYLLQLSINVFKEVCIRMHYDHLPISKRNMNFFIWNQKKVSTDSFYVYILHINLPEWCFKRLVMTLTNVSGQINNCHHPWNTLLNPFSPLKKSCSQIGDGILDSCYISRAQLKQEPKSIWGCKIQLQIRKKEDTKSSIKKP